MDITQQILGAVPQCCYVSRPLHRSSAPRLCSSRAHALENENFENPIYLPCNPIVTQSIQIE